MNGNQRHIDKQLAIMEFTNREFNFSHTQYDEEALQYQLLKAGDPEAVNISRMYFKESRKVKFTEDPLVNMRYMFVVSATLATRYAIEGGLNSETAYNISDIFIRKMHKECSLEAISDLQAEMIEYFTGKMREIHTHINYSKPVVMAVEYIEQHLHEPIRMEDLSDASLLSESYLSILFKKETGSTITEYITARRIDTAKNMLLHSDFTLNEISEILAFSSQSYFTSVFRKYTGQTPRQYRKDNYLNTLKGNRAN